MQCKTCWCSEPKRGTSEGSGSARDASFVPPCRHPVAWGPSLYFKSPTLHTQDIHWIDNEARGPGDPQLASGGPAHPSRLASPPSIEKRCALPSACCADHPSIFASRRTVAGPSLMLGPNNVPTRRNHNRPPAHGEYRTKLL